MIERHKRGSGGALLNYYTYKNLMGKLQEIEDQKLKNIELGL
jgi:hypothetical protein